MAERGSKVVCWICNSIGRYSASASTARPKGIRSSKVGPSTKLREPVENLMVCDNVWAGPNGLGIVPITCRTDRSAKASVRGTPPFTPTEIQSCAWQEIAATQLTSRRCGIRHKVISNKMCDQVGSLLLYEACFKLPVARSRVDGIVRVRFS
jgi:hypothetical protein